MSGQVLKALWNWWAVGKHPEVPGWRRYGELMEPLTVASVGKMPPLSWWSNWTRETHFGQNDQLHKAAPSLWASARGLTACATFSLCCPVAAWKSLSFPLPVHCLCLSLCVNMSAEVLHFVCCWYHCSLSFCDFAITRLQLLLPFLCTPHSVEC